MADLTEPLPFDMLVKSMVENKQIEDLPEIINIEIIEKCQRTEKKKLETIWAILDGYFKTTQGEKIENVIEEIFKFQDTASDFTAIWRAYNRMSNMIEKEELEKHLELFITKLCMKKFIKEGTLNDGEMLKIKDVIRDNEENDKAVRKKFEETIVAMKIEGIKGKEVFCGNNSQRRGRDFHKNKYTKNYIENKHRSSSTHSQTHQHSQTRYAQRRDSQRSNGYRSDQSRSSSRPRENNFQNNQGNKSNYRQ